MTRAQSPQVEFARRGFAQPASAARMWASWPDEDRALVDLAWFEPVADRFQALDTLDQIRSTDRFRAVVTDPGWCRRVLRVAGASSALARALAREPDLVACLADEPVERDEQAWEAFFQARTPIVDGECHVDADELRLANRAALTMIAARDLEADDPTDAVEGITRELSHVADNVLRVSLALACAEVPDWRDVRLAVVALGKCGAQELNYLSDVDVIHLAEPARDDIAVDHAMSIATRIAAAQARICSAHTRAGTIWTLDTGLRPEGKAGPLVRTLESCRHYYEEWAKNWEFQAMLKARPAAGDAELGEAFVDMVSPMVWEAGRRDGFLPEMRAMRERVISLIPAAQAERDIKLSSGGLRDTEFTVQLLQLVHGRADERIRTRGTFEGLRLLVGCGYIGRDDGTRMGEHYRFQRVLEHRAQLMHLRRTHLVPDEPERLAELARTTGCTEVAECWRASRRDVRRLRQRIFFSPLLDTVTGVPTESILSPEAAKERMQAIGFEDARTALGHIEALTAGTSRAAEIRRQLMPAMLEWIADGPNPDFGLLSFRQLSEALGESNWYLRAMRDEGYMAQRLAKVASTSRYTVGLLQRSPQTVRLLASEAELHPREPQDLIDALRKSAARHDDAAKAIESARSMRRNELCRIALVDVLGGVDIDTCGRALSDLASASLEAALDVARRDVDAPELGVVALGRWGGAEMSYSSDLDCMFVVPDGTNTAGMEAATKLVRRVTDIVGRPGPDLALMLDSDLRPGGKSGPQVRTVSSYATYYEQWAATWEHQMLLRGRPGAGSRALAEAVLTDAEHHRFPDGGLTTAQVTDIRRLKSRMERERIPRGIDRDRHLKLGPGGLSDIEWTVQLIQMQHGHAHEQLRTTSTLGAMEAARTLGIIEGSDADDLAAAWRHASAVRDAIMLVRGRASDALPTDPRDLAAINTLLGIDGPATELGEITRRHARRASAVVERLFWAG